MLSICLFGAFIDTNRDRLTLKEVLFKYGKCNCSFTGNEFCKQNKLLNVLIDTFAGFLYSEYRSGFYFWESVVMLRKLGFVAVIVFLQRFGACMQLAVSFT
jgi:hypothetical protein